MLFGKKVCNYIISSLTEAMEASNQRAITSIKEELEYSNIYKHIKAVLLSVYGIINPYKNSYFIIPYIHESSSRITRYITTLLSNGEFYAIPIDLYHDYEISNIKVHKVGINEDGDTVAFVSYRDILKPYECYIIFNERMDIGYKGITEKSKIFYIDNSGKGELYEKDEDSAYLSQ